MADTVEDILAKAKIRIHIELTLENDRQSNDNHWWRGVSIEEEEFINFTPEIRREHMQSLVEVYLADLVGYVERFIENEKP